MDQHPVPQNVTTFQFRLIGDMTIKQFGYLAGGAILAYVSYKLPLPFFFSWPLTIVFALGGVGFAFVPIEERPMDVWVLSFLKNVYSPTVFTWEQTAQQRSSPAKQPIPAPVISTQQKASISTIKTQHAPGAVVSQTQATPSSPLPFGTKTTASVVSTMYAPKSAAAPYIPTAHQQSQPSAGMFDWIFDLFKPKTPIAPVTPAIPTQAPHMTTPSVVGSHLDISMPPTVAKQQTHQKTTVEPVHDVSVPAQKNSTLPSKPVQDPDSRISDLQRQLAEALAQKDKLSQDINSVAPQKKTVLPLHPQMEQPDIKAPQSATPAYPQKIDASTKQTQKQPTVKIITPEGAVRAGLPRLTTFPNVVTGITKDSDNNFLPGVLVTVKDKDGIPVRALKTNRLGQFAASTPLSNGVYFVEIEDPRQRYTFDRVQITLNGSIVPALEIITKSQKQISRDKLAKELFGNTTQ